MLISDWCSDVCSSERVHGFQAADLFGILQGKGKADCDGRGVHRVRRIRAGSRRFPCPLRAGAVRARRRAQVTGLSKRQSPEVMAGAGPDAPKKTRSEERRVGEECGSKGRSRWAPFLSKKKKNAEQRERMHKETVQNI